MTAPPQLRADPPASPAAPGDDTELPLRTAAVTGSTAAFADLYRQTRPTVHKYLLRRLNGDQHLAEDLTHETFARALARIDSFREMGRPFVAWLLTIAGNLLADYYKSGWRRRQLTWSDLGFEVDSGSSALMWNEYGDGDGADTTVVAGEHRRYIRSVLTRAMADLTPWQRQVLWLRYFEGLSVRDTALKLDSQEGAIKAATHRAVRLLSRDPRVGALGTDLPG